MKKIVYAMSMFVWLIAGHVMAACNPDMAITKPDNIYDDRGDGTVVDAETGLMWQKCPMGASGAGCEMGKPKVYDWKSAMASVQKANLDAGMLGYTDWRMPNIRELASLGEVACGSPYMNTVIFPPIGYGKYNTMYFWSSTPDIEKENFNNDAVKVIDFNQSVFPQTSSRTHTNMSIMVRLVRGGL